MIAIPQIQFNVILYPSSQIPNADLSAIRLSPTLDPNLGNCPRCHTGRESMRSRKVIRVSVWPRPRPAIDCLGSRCLRELGLHYSWAVLAISSHDEWTWLDFAFLRSDEERTTCLCVIHSFPRPERRTWSQSGPTNDGTSNERANAWAKSDLRAIGFDVRRFP